MSIKDKLLSSRRSTKVSLVACADFFCISLAMYLAILVSNIPIDALDIFSILRLFWIPLFSVLIFYILGVYRSVVRYINFSAIYVILKAILTVFFINLFLRYLILEINYLKFIFDLNNSPISILGWFVGLTTTTLLVIGTRLIANYILDENDHGNKVIIYGAGSSGIQLASALKVSKEMDPIAFVDKNRNLHGTYLAGIKILPPDKLEHLVKKNKISEVLIAIPSASKSTLRELLKEIEEYSVKVRILPGLADLATGKVLVSELKEVDFADLLGRSEVEAYQTLLDKNIKHKVVLVTGAGGSIGSEIARQASKNNPKSLILLDSNEYSLYGIKEELNQSADIDLYSVLADIKDEKRILRICEAFAVDTIYHAAAYKHVPLVEENPFEGIKNNIFGTLSCVNAAMKSDVETFVLISTDKAVRPTNIMGASKRFAEMILQSLATDIENKSRTKMTMVRFGNVLGSSGSALPLFKRQIEDGGPVTVTDPEIIRYFMTIPEAATLVIQAGAMGDGGDVFLLDMGEPVKILELAKRLIKLSGYELKDEDNPKGDIEIVFTGLRPGEKLYEELLIGDNAKQTQHKQIFKASEDFLEKKDMDNLIELLTDAVHENDNAKLKSIFETSIHGFSPEKEIVDFIHTHKKKLSVFTYIDTRENLSYLNQELLNKPFVGVDTEFRRTTKDNMRLALLQINDGEEIYLVDTVKINNPNNDCSFLFSNSVLKIFHSCKEDLEAIFAWTNRQMVNIFDTQLANALLNINFSISYQDLVEEKIGVVLEKKETRSNWLEDLFQTINLNMLPWMLSI